VLGCNADCSWYELANDCWIAAFLVELEAPLPPTPPLALPTVVINIPVALPNPGEQPTRCPQTLGPTTTYAGPGTFYPVVDTRPAGECVAVVGRNALGDWLQLSHGMWIPTSALVFVEPIELLPITDRIFTATPEPTPTASTPFQFSAEEQSYLEFINLQATLYETVWGGLANQFQLVEQNSVVIFTDDWRILTAAALAFIRVANDDTRNRIPPPLFVPAHNELVNATNAYDQVVNLVIEGLDNFDASKLLATSALMDEGNAAIDRALVLFEDAVRQRQNPQLALTPTPTATPLPELLTVGEWTTASPAQKEATAIIWTQRYVAAGRVTGDAQAFAAALLTCVDNTLRGTAEILGPAYPAQTVADGCATTLH
jgi:hypothetical protein